MSNHENAFYSDLGISIKISNNLISQNPIVIGTIEQPILQSECAIAIGEYAGNYNQGECTIAIGSEAGNTGQGMMAIAIGSGTGIENQKNFTIALGSDAGSQNQSTSSIAIGKSAGLFNQGVDAIAIGTCTGQTNQYTNSVILNATGASLNTIVSNPNTYMTPIRNDLDGNRIITYDSSSKEILESDSVDFNMTVNGDLIFQRTTNFQEWWAKRMSLPFPQNSIDLTSITNIPSNPQYNGGVVAPNGKIYFIPYFSADIMILDPATNTFSNISAGPLPLVENKYFGGVLASNGKIYCVPRASAITTVLIIDPTTNTIDTTSITVPGTTRWAGPALAPNGKIYCVPADALTVLVVDPSTNTTATIATTGGGYEGAVLAPNGKIYGIPFSATSVLEINPATNTVANIGSLGTGNKWSGGALGLDGKIYGMPANSTSVLIIDPAGPSTDVTSITGIAGNNKCRGGVAALNGKIYGMMRDPAYNLIVNPSSPITNIPGVVPANASYTNTSPARTFVCTGASFLTTVSVGDNILIQSTSGNFTGYVESITDNTTLVFVFALGVNLALGTITGIQKTRKADVTTITTLGTLGAKYWNGALAPNGKIYGAAYQALNTLIIDTTTNTADTTTILLPNGLAKWYGGVLAPSGKIYGVPYSYPSVLIVDPVTNSWEATSIGGLSGTFKWIGGVVARNGKIYCAPASETRVLIIDPESPITSIPNLIPALASYNNTTQIFTCPGATFTTSVTVGDNLLIQTASKQYTGYIQSIFSDTAVVFVYPLGVTLNAGTITGIQRTRKADVTTISGLSTQGGLSKWAGAVLAPNGKIYIVPRDNQNIVVVDPSNDSFVYIPLGFGTGYCRGAVLGTDGKIYTIPSTAPYVLIIDPATNTVDWISITGLSSTSGKWASGVLAPNGKIYGMPLNENRVLILDPSSPVTNIAAVVPANASYTDTSPARTFVCSGATFLSTVTVGDNILIQSTLGNFTGYVSTVTNNTTLVFVYALGVNLPLGSITSIQKTRKADVTTISGLSTVNFSWWGGTLAMSGIIYGVPFADNRVLVLNPTTNTVSFFTTSVGIPVAGLGRSWWGGGILAPNGKVYYIPYNAPSVGIINAGLSTIPNPWPTEPYFNKL